MAAVTMVRGQGRAGTVAGVVAGTAACGHGHGGRGQQSSPTSGPLTSHGCRLSGAGSLCHRDGWIQGGGHGLGQRQGAGTIRVSGAGMGVSRDSSAGVGRDGSAGAGRDSSAGTDSGWDSALT